MKVVFDWGVSDRYGWGVYGINLCVHGQQHPGVSVIPKRGGDLKNISNPLTRAWLQQRLAGINRVSLGAEDRYLQGLGNIPQVRQFPQIPSYGVIFFEDTNVTRERLDALRSFDAIVTGSRWNERFLTGLGVRTRFCIQGVATQVFKPAPKKLFRDRPVVFSGGKLEYRKGQDIVVKAFSRFCRRHPDALLIAAWSSPWSLSLMTSVNRSGTLTPIENMGSFERSVESWLQKNDIPSKNFIVMPSVQNEFLPQVFAETDMAIFPNRCEGGTNLVAMEAISCGVPSIVSNNTGHEDLVEMGVTQPLLKQGIISGRDTQDWGESDVEELVTLMESNLSTKQKDYSACLHQQMANLDWSFSIQRLLSNIL